jgi:hypothetical protein
MRLFSIIQRRSGLMNAFLAVNHDGELVLMPEPRDTAVILRFDPLHAFLPLGGGIVRTLSVVTTFVFVALGWVLFAAPSFREASVTLQRTFSL